ncbi:MAG: hypothetical protein KDD62_02275, partial [Bdellovibrionales bacterium]|nr:hypothetical protein [Bdellovibrionales bacterium]
CFEPRIDMTDAAAIKVYTMAHLRNAEGESLYCSTDIDGNRRWQLSPVDDGPVLVEFCTELPAYASLDVNACEGLALQHKVLYTPHAFIGEMNRLKDSHYVRSCLLAGSEGSHLLYEILRKAEERISLDEAKEKFLEKQGWGLSVLGGTVYRRRGSIPWAGIHMSGVLYIDSPYCPDERPESPEQLGLLSFTLLP